MSEWAPIWGRTAGGGWPFTLGLWRPVAEVVEVHQHLRRHSHRQKVFVDADVGRVLDPCETLRRSCKAAWDLWLWAHAMNCELTLSRRRGKSRG